MIFWKTVTIRRHSHAILYDRFHAVSQHMTVVTNDIKHFSSVPGLMVEVWS
jgi:hypothetical protein